MSSVATLSIGVRFIHLLAGVALVGAAGMLLLAGPSDRPTAIRWEARVLRSIRGLVIVALASGVGALLLQTAEFAGRPHAALEPAMLGRALLATHAGIVWLARMGLLLLLAVFAFMRVHVASKLDWVAGRGELLLLAGGAAALVSFSGHAIAVTPGTAGAVLNDALHVLATGLWFGGLPPLAMLLHAAGRDGGEDARAYAVVAARRFSRLALALVIALVATGVVNAVIEIGSVAGLLGTTHGRLLLGKLALLVPILALAAVNRSRTLPALSGPGEAVGRPAMRRLARSVAIEAVLLVALLGVVAVMTVTPPALHVEPTWPFPFRFTYAALAEMPALRIRAVIAGQIAVLGVVAVIASALMRRHRWPVLAGGVVLVAVGAGVALPPLTVGAYPSTFRRPAVSYQASSIAAGGEIFRERCAGCHGITGTGNGPGGRGLERLPADLHSAHTDLHTAGDLFWWISRGIPGSRMPAFAGQLSAEDRWDVVNFIRALAAADAVQKLGPTVEPERPWLVAPDFTFSVGPAAPRVLKDYRGRRIVLLVLYSWPASKPRLAELARAYDSMAMLGSEIIAVPLDASPEAIRRIGAEPRILFPIVTDGADEIVQTYRLFGVDGHAEFLIDRQGYLRARWTAPTPAMRDVNLLLAEIQQLNQEKASVPEAAEHVH